MTELIRQIVAALVDYPEAIRLREIQGAGTVVYELQVAKGDLGKVIGRHGRTARAIRTIVSAAGMKLHLRARLELLESAPQADSAAVGQE